MAYTPTEWNCGDTITAEKMNKIEQGIADSGGGTEPLFIYETEDKFTFVADAETGDVNTYHYLNVTLSEVKQAVLGGRLCIWGSESSEEMEVVTYFSSEGITDTGNVVTKSVAIEENHGDQPRTDDRPDAPLDTLTAQY